MGVASFENSGATFLDLRMRVAGCLRGEGLAAGSSATLERVERFATAGLLEDFLAGTLSDEGTRMSTEKGCWSGISLIPERVVRDFVVFAGAFLVTVVVVVVMVVAAAVVALGAEGGLRRRIGRGMTEARVYWRRLEVQIAFNIAITMGR